MTSFRDIPIPLRMQHLRKDRRGFPIPFVVLIDKGDTPQFTINDTRQVDWARANDLCGICGQRLLRGRWFAGGPASALHQFGAYFDGPLHDECVHYALRVCPWLAAPKYARRIEDRKLKPGAVEPGRVFIDPTQIPTRPTVFVAVMSIGHKLTTHGTFLPNRPYRKIEFWYEGVQLSDSEGWKRARADLERIAGSARMDST